MNNQYPEITDEGWECCRIHVPVDEIGFIAGIMEAYDNEFLVRTERKGMGFLRIWYPKSNRKNLEKIFRDFQSSFTLEIVSFEEGMAGLDEVFAG